MTSTVSHNGSHHRCDSISSFMKTDIVLSTSALNHRLLEYTCLGNPYTRPPLFYPHQHTQVRTMLCVKIVSPQAAVLNFTISNKIPSTISARKLSVNIRGRSPWKAFNPSPHPTVGNQSQWSSQNYPGISRLKPWSLVSKQVKVASEDGCLSEIDFAWTQISKRVVLQI